MDRTFKLVVLESPYSGDVEANIKYARRCMLDVLRRDESPIVPHLLYTQVLNDNNTDERNLGIYAGLAWCKVADYTVVYVDRGISSGMKIGISYMNLVNKMVMYKRIDPLPTPFYILVHGKRCTGKDTIAALLQELLGKAAHIMGFANTLKQTYANKLDPDNSSGTYFRLLNDYSFKAEHRKELMSYAHSEKVEHGEDIWVKRLLAVVNTVMANFIIIPDMRFKYEFHHSEFTKLNSIKIKVTCDNTIRRDRGWDYKPLIDCDISETDLDIISDEQFDVVFVNNYSIEWLREKCQKLVRQYCLI